MENQKLHYIVVTGIVIKDGKFLIAKRGLDQAAFPGLWTVPGGKLRKSDYSKTPKDTPDSWYNVLEKALEREIEEETELKIKDINYLTNVVYIRSDGIPTMVMNFYCTYKSGEVRVSGELVEHAWVGVNELKKYKLLSGIREELEIVDEILKKGKRRAWTGKYNNPRAKRLRDGI